MSGTYADGKFLNVSADSGKIHLNIQRISVSTLRGYSSELLEEGKIYSISIYLPSYMTIPITFKVIKTVYDDNGLGFVGSIIGMLPFYANILTEYVHS
ncbi:hypothetical protein D3C81_09350 [compost metagenome]